MTKTDTADVKLTVEQIKKLEAVTAGQRLDSFLAKANPELSRAQVQKLINSGLVTVNGKSGRPSFKLKEGDLIIMTVPPPEPASLEPQEIPFELVYEDTDFIVINKPAGLTIHPAPGHSSGTLVNALIKRFPDLKDFGPTLRPGIVHRLDKDTSGLMVIARHEKASRHLINQFKTRAVKKRYLLLVKGRLTPETGFIEAPVGRHPVDRKRMAVVTSGRDARTGYRVKQYYDGYTLVEAEIETGRTHQIRVHFAAIGYPVIGDAIYGVKSTFLHRQFLHSHHLEFRALTGNNIHAFTCDLPADLKDALETIRR